MTPPPGSDLIFVTSNADKLREAEQILGRRLGMASPAVEELQTIHLEELVAHKARGAFQQLRHPLFVEDTALGFSAWNGMPGPFIKFFLEGLGEEGLARALSPFADQGALARCGVGYHDGEQVHYFEGQVAGTIVMPRGSNGFGWDIIFQPEGESRTFGEMAAEEKHRLSMRARAMEKLGAFLQARG